MKNNSHVTGAWYNTMATRLSEKRGQIHQARLQVDKEYAERHALRLMCLLAQPWVFAWNKLKQGHERVFKINLFEN